MGQAQDLTEVRAYKPLTWIGDRLVRWRRPLLVFLGLFLILAEVFEHTGGEQRGITIDFLSEAFLLGIVLPGLLYLVLNRLAEKDERAKLDRVAAVVAERNVISRDLHDTFGQQLGFLHFKLDQLASGDLSNQGDELRRQLIEMRDVSNEAYEQVTGIVSILRDSGASPIGETLLMYAQSIGSRAGFEARLVRQGQARLLPIYVCEQILHIFREAIGNAGRHAGAKHLVISIAWATDYVDIRVSDDGRGFDASAPRLPGHFGRAIMGERALEIGGQLCLSSRPGLGTDVALRVPLGRVEVILPHNP